MVKKSIVGDLINFRGLVYSPINENGVIFIFGKVIEDLNMYIEEIKPGFPDCIGRRFTGKGWERANIEFEYKSSNFRSHKHNPKECDIIVCWEHDWKDCPLEVIELREVIKGLPQRPIVRPGDAIVSDYSIEEHKEKAEPFVRTLFEKVDAGLREIDDDIWLKPMKKGATYYCPERVFIFLTFQKKGLRLKLFTSGKEIKGVERSWSVAGEKWGSIHIENKKDIPTALNACKESYKRIKNAIKVNEPTGWGAEIGDEEED